MINGPFSRAICRNCRISQREVLDRGKNCRLPGHQLIPLPQFGDKNQRDGCCHPRCGRKNPALHTWVAACGAALTGACPEVRTSPASVSSDQFTLPSQGFEQVIGDINCLFGRLVFDGKHTAVHRSGVQRNAAPSSARSNPGWTRRPPASNR